MLEYIWNLMRTSPTKRPYELRGSELVSETLFEELNTKIKEVENNQRMRDSQSKRDSGIPDYSWLISDSEKSYKIPTLLRIELEDLTNQIDPDDTSHVINCFRKSVTVETPIEDIAGCFKAVLKRHIAVRKFKDTTKDKDKFRKGRDVDQPIGNFKHRQHTSKLREKSVTVNLDGVEETNHARVHSAPASSWRFFRQSRVKPINAFSTSDSNNREDKERRANSVPTITTIAPTFKLPVLFLFKSKKDTNEETLVMITLKHENLLEQLEINDNNSKELQLKRDFTTICETHLSNDEQSWHSKVESRPLFVISGRYNGNLYLLVKLLLPGVQKRVYNLKDKQIVKLFSQVFETDCDDMVEDLERGNVSETVTEFYKKSNGILPCKQSKLTLAEVDEFLNQLAAETKEDDQLRVLKKISTKCTAEDLKFIVRLIKHDLRMNTGAKHVLDALDVNAYAAYQACSNLKDVIAKLTKRSDVVVSGLKKTLSIKASLMTPVKPMLAEAAKSISTAMKKCPNGMYAEIKYDGERVQVHKQGVNFNYFSRSLKVVQPHKVAEIKDFLPKAFPEGDNLILDGEVLLVDNETGKPLPFGTLGIHKKSKFKDASVCYVIFDILQLNGDNLMSKPIVERRNILESSVEEIKNHIIISEMTHITKESELKEMLDNVFAKNLEGLVLKDLQSTYEPGKRHWLKMKKDYLHEGAMADSADLVVLGAYFGTGNKGGLMSVFLMGCFNPHNKKWVTVAKCGNGHDDKMINKIQKQLKVKKIRKDFSLVPSWLDVKRSLVPDFIVEDPKKAPVWEITGAEFSKSNTHTANGISIRFPRVTKIRDDKDWQTATDLPTLQQLFDNSKTTSDDVVMPELDDKKNETEIDPNKGEKLASESTKKKPLSFEKTSKKRKSDESNEDEATLAKKSKPLCKYGNKCYQSNKEHLNKYDHLASKADEIVDLKNLFTGKKFFIDQSVENVQSLKRYIIAYDGDVIDDFQLGEATHFITDKKETKLPSIPKISPDSIWKSIKGKCLLPGDEFLSSS
eukprot:gene6365-7097_t